MVYRRSYSYEGDLSGDEDLYANSVSRRAGHMVAAALDDSDASVRKSRRHDDALMRNINSRLGKSDAMNIETNVHENTTESNQFKSMYNKQFMLDRNDSLANETGPVVRPVESYSYNRKTRVVPKQISATAALKGQEAFSKPSSAMRTLSRIQDYWHEGDLEVQPRIYPNTARRSMQQKSVMTYGKKGSPRYSDYYYPEFYRFSSCTPVNQASTILCTQKKLLSTYEPDMPPPSTYSHLRDRLRTIHDGVDRQRLMLDRYIPVDLSAKDVDVASGIINKFEEMTDRMPEIRSSTSTTKSSSESSVNSKPQMSETRRKLRDTIKKSHKDPSYYN